MAKTDLDRLLALLPSLTPKEKVEATKALKALSQFDRESPDSTADVDEDLVLEAIYDVLTRRGAEFTSPGMYYKSRSFPSFRAKIPALMRYVRQAAQTRQQQRYLLSIGINSLYNYLFAKNIPINYASILRTIDLVPAMVNRAFPGYAESGLLGMIVRAKETNGHTYRA